MSWVDTERPVLAATFRSADPAGPTLDEGWTVRHLLGHLVMRDQDLVASVKDVAARAKPGQEKQLGALVAGAQTPAGYEALIRRFEAGPPRWSPLRWAGDKANLLEYVVHHEDVRRAGPTPAPPRVLPEGLQDALWQQLPLAARLTFRKAPVGVSLQWPGRQLQVVKRAEPGVVVTGEPVELALYVTGRRPAATVELSGDPAAVARFQAWATN